MAQTSVAAGEVTAAPSRGEDPTWREHVRTWAPEVAAVAIIALLLAPLAPLVLFSVGDAYFFPQVIPDNLSLRAWETALRPGQGTWGAMVTSLVVAIAVTALSLAVSVPAGRAMGLYQFRGKRVVEFLLLAPVLVPTIAVAIGIQVMFIRFGLANTIPGVVLVHLVPTLPYVTLIVAGVFSNYEVELEEQARSLGASPVRTWWYVVLPSIRPGLVVAAFFGFLVSWSQYTLTLLIGGGEVVTLPILVFSLATGGDLALTSATALIFTIPAVALLVLNARYLTGEENTLGGLGGV